MSTLNDALQALKTGTISPVYLLYGTEQYFIEQFKHTLIQSLQDDESEEITTYDLTEVAIQDVITDVETLPFFQDHKLIVASQPVFLKTKQDSIPVTHDLKQLERYVSDPVPYSTLVLIAPYEKLDERKKITKTLKKKATMINCNPINSKELRKWINYMAKQNQIELTDEALFLLEAEFETNLNLLHLEIEKLALFVGEHGQVTKEIVAKLISSSITHSALELVDAVLQKNLPLAIKIYKDLEKQKEDPIGMIALLAYQFRVIFQVKLFKKKGYTNQMIQQQVKVHPYVIKLAAKRSTSFSVERLSEIVNELTNTDAAIKQGKLDKGIAFEMLLYKLITA